MAPLGMIIKLVEPVSEGTSMKRMLKLIYRCSLRWICSTCAQLNSALVI